MYELLYIQGLDGFLMSNQIWNRFVQADKNVPKQIFIWSGAHYNPI